MARRAIALAWMALMLPAIGETGGAASRDEWRTYGGDAANTRYSALHQIDTANVTSLLPAWTLRFGMRQAQEATPLVIGDTMYVTTSSGPRDVYALDAKTGTVRWRYAPAIAANVAATVCCGLVNRGAAYAGGKLFFGSLDGYLTALDAKSGKEIWRTRVVDYRQGAAITSPPLVVKNLVVTGYAGGEYGVRGGDPRVRSQHRP